MTFATHAVSASTNQIPNPSAMIVPTMMNPRTQAMTM